MKHVQIPGSVALTRLLLLHFDLSVSEVARSDPASSDPGHLTGRAFIVDTPPLGQPWPGSE